MLKRVKVQPIATDVKLADPLKLKGDLATEHYARVLRVIGQDLTNLFPQDFEIQSQGKEFVVRGHCARKRLEEKIAQTEKLSVKSIFVKILNRELHVPASNAEPDIVEFSRTYTPEDIDRFDEIALSRRTGMNRIPDPRSLGESLRTIGRLLDANKGQLTLLVGNQDRVIVEYRDQDDQPQKEELKHLDLYKLQQRFYKNRGTFNPIDQWKGHD